MVHLLEDEEQVRADMENARREADVLLVFVHWGTEDSAEVDDFQKRWTKVFLDGRADVVVGTHPHVLQEYELLEGADGHRMLVYYSIGNFVSAQAEKSCVKGGMARFWIAPAPGGYGVTEYGLTPLTITRERGGRYMVTMPEGRTNRVIDSFLNDVEDGEPEMFLTRLKAFLADSPTETTVAPDPSYRNHWNRAQDRLSYPD